MDTADEVCQGSVESLQKPKGIGDVEGCGVHAVDAPLRVVHERLAEDPTSTVVLGSYIVRAAVERKEKDASPRVLGTRMCELLVHT